MDHHDHHGQHGHGHGHGHGMLDVQPSSWAPNYHPSSIIPTLPPYPSSSSLEKHHHHHHQHDHHNHHEEEEEEEDHQQEEEEEELGAMKEMMYRIASMQPVDIDPATIRRPKRRNVRISDDPQSVAARLRRERISDKIRILQRLVPGGTKMDTASMLEEAIRYVKFLKRQIRILQNPGPFSSGSHWPGPGQLPVVPENPGDQGSKVVSFREVLQQGSMVFQHGGN